MKKYLIIYHKEDNDGLFSMAIIYNYLTNELHADKSDIELRGVDYVEVNMLGVDYLTEHYENIIMTDISMQGDSMHMLYNKLGSNFIWIDHHAPIIKQSIEDRFDGISGLRDTTRSAILNAYKFLYDLFDLKYNDKTLPMYFRILSAWDSFSYEREGYTLDYVRNVNVGTNIIYKLNPESIIEIVYKIMYEYPKAGDPVYYINKAHDLGKQINDIKDDENAALIKNSGDFTWTVDGRTACALFIQGPSNSIMFKSVPENILHGIVFKRNTNGSWTISLYNTRTELDKEYHCGNYLKKKYKGGGHAGAAGCQVDEKKFIKILKTKQV